jgi:putative peptidoglycan lipid II flippase
LPAFILVKVLAPGFYSRQDTKTPVRIGIISVISNIVLSILIVYPWYTAGIVGPHAGLALATTLAGYINAGMLFYQLKKQQIYQPLAKLKKVWIKDISRIVIAMVVMAVVVTVVNPADIWWQDAGIWQKIGRLLALVSAAIVSYFAVLYLLGVRKKTFSV